MPRIRRFVLLSLLILISACQQNEIIVKQRILAFGTLIDINIASDHANQKLANQTIEIIRTHLKNKHHEWHAWKEGDLSQLNSSLNSQVTTIHNDDLIKLISLSKNHYQKTNGLFNPAIGKLIQAWGFHDPKSKNMELIDSIKQNMPSMDDIELTHNTVISHNEFVQLDFGGIAKALAIIQIKDILAQHNFNDYLINIGGDIYSHGTRHTDNWITGIQNPFKQGALATFKLKKNGNIFTSGNYQRYKMQGKKRIHHIIDPRTGEPSIAAASVTIHHHDPVTADVAATALMIASHKERSQIVKNMAIQDYLVVSPNQQIWVSRSFYNKLTFNTELKINIIEE